MVIKILSLQDESVDEILGEWRHAAFDGFQRLSDDAARELYAKISLVLANYQLRYSAALARETSAKRQVEFVLRKLMNTVYMNGSVASRETKAKADGEYSEIYEKWQTAERDRIIEEGYLNALQTSAQQISRDMGFRLKN